MSSKKNKKDIITKSELLKKVAEIATVNGVECNASQVRVILESYEKVLLKEWKEAEEFRLLNIGKLKIKHSPERIGVNPATGEKVKYPAKCVPKMSFNKSVKEFILGNLRK